MAIIISANLLDSRCMINVDQGYTAFPYVYGYDVVNGGDSDAGNFADAVNDFVLDPDFISAVSTDGTISEATSDNLGGHLGAWVARPGAPAQWPPGAPTGFDDGPVRPPGAFCRTLLSLTAATV